MFYTGWSASTGEADWAPLFASQNWPPTLFNTAFYSNPQVDNAERGAENHRSATENQTL